MRMIIGAVIVAVAIFLGGLAVVKVSGYNPGTFVIAIVALISAAQAAWRLRPHADDEVK